MRKYLQKLFINWLVKDLFNTVTVDDLLRVVKVQGRRVVLFHGKQLDQDYIDKLQADAERFEKSTFWKLLSDESRYIANKTIYEKSRTVEDIVAGKLLLYLVQIWQKKIKQIARL